MIKIENVKVCIFSHTHNQGDSKRSVAAQGLGERKVGGISRVQSMFRAVKL